MYENVRQQIEKRYGSINRLSKALNIQAGDLYSAFSGARPMYPKYKRLIAEALGKDEEKLFPEGNR